MQNYFLESFDDCDLKIKLREHEPRDLHEAYIAAQRYESYQKVSEMPDCSNDKSTFYNRWIQMERNNREMIKSSLRELRVECLEAEIQNLW